MKIFYAVQATGNGHISRAKQILPYLTKYGQVDIFLSGSNSSLNPDLPIAYKNKGLSLCYNRRGGLDYLKTVRKLNVINALETARSLPVEKYDVILNDFESITALACKIKRLKSIQFGHQASFYSKLTPRPEKKDKIGEMVLKYFAKSTHYAGLHFAPYDDGIFTPIIKEEILQAEVRDLGHLTVYLPAMQKSFLGPFLKSLSDIEFHVFDASVQLQYSDENIVYYPINNNLFNKSMFSCHGIITGGGFETPAEALYLKKKIISIPIKNHYEQECNAAALQKLGVKVLKKLDFNSKEEIQNWMLEKNTAQTIIPNNIDHTLQWIFRHLVS